MLARLPGTDRDLSQSMQDSLNMASSCPLAQKMGTEPIEWRSCARQRAYRCNAIITALLLVTYHVSFRDYMVFSALYLAAFSMVADGSVAPSVSKSGVAAFSSGLSSPTATASTSTLLLLGSVRVRAPDGTLMEYAKM